MPWVDCDLGDIVTLKRGYDLPKSVRNDGSIPVVSSAGITGFHDASKAKSPGVVTGRYGTLGEVYFLEEPFWPLNTALYAVDFHGNKPRFVAYLLKSKLGNYRSEKAAVPGVDRNVLHKLSSQCPDLQTQERIVAILSPYDNLIAVNIRRIALLEKAARLLYREWFMHLRFPGHENRQIIDGVPEGWTSMSLSEAVWVRPRNDKPRSDSIVKVPMSALSTISMQCDTSDFSLSNKYSGATFKNGDTLLARITPCLENGKTAYVNFLQEGETACGSTEFIVMRERIISRFQIYLLSRCDEFREVAIKSMTGSSGRQRVDEEVIGQFRVLVAPECLAKEFDDLVRDFFASIKILAEQNQTLARARDLLLPRLMDGRIELAT